MQTSPPRSDQPGPGVPMMVVVSDSDSDSDDGSGGCSATFLVPNFDGELPAHISTAVMMSESDSEEELASAIPSGSGYGRDPITGEYTAASFANFQDEWLS